MDEQRIFDKIDDIVRTVNENHEETLKSLGEMGRWIAGLPCKEHEEKCVNLKTQVYAIWGLLGVAVISVFGYVFTSLTK